MISMAGLRLVQIWVPDTRRPDFADVGISVRALSIALHVPYSRLREIVDGHRGVSADTALRLERYFGSEAQGWLNLQAAYDLRVAEKLSSRIIAKEIELLAAVE